MKNVGPNRWLVTEPTPIQIGRPEYPPTPEVLGLLKEAVASSGAEEVYWFWVSISGDQPHLGLGVAPDDDEVVSAIGKAVERLWTEYSPSNPVFDILRLGDASLDKTIRHDGALLFRRSAK